MLFDIRGRRKHVVRVVYAILALLMGASLFLLAGPVGIGSLFEGDSSNGASVIFDEQAERIERKLQSTPKDEALLLALTRARINAGNALAEADPETGRAVFPAEANAEFEQAGEAWSRYLKQTNSPSPTGAQLVSRMYFSRAEASTASFEEISQFLNNAAKAQRIVADVQPTASTLSTLAFYEYFAGNFAAGDKARGLALGMISSKEEQESVAGQLIGYRQAGEEFAKQKKEFAKSQQGKGKEVLENPLGGLGGGGGLGE